ncbi:MAG: hypothetical protein JGK17_20605 [Microcoleus sp. PH2017_10_PVI_O_A]|nr:hypothetical protein [Microcoleus sp. PH2017_10_PVI_O_A]MCC3462117.1 hypothetical protein [Microcoleus sp. PH2017_11_PCY_U_A]MCC3480550.1 hypothetical protein [Microcoleus sp. PH2017_12_PCY_D_A]MCC3561439.1 hypothetical protein [Microcoleus sp. PH2017_27_LUM_O_A]
MYPGRATAIDFSSTDEALAYVLIADPFSNLNIQPTFRRYSIGFNFKIIQNQKSLK